VLLVGHPNCRVPDLPEVAHWNPTSTSLVVLSLQLGTPTPGEGLGRGSAAQWHLPLTVAPLSLALAHPPRFLTFALSAIYVDDLLPVSWTPRKGV
jgi:hypothetical protein